MQSLDNDKIKDVEQTVKELFASFKGNSDFKESVMEHLDKIHIFGFYGENVSRFAFFPGHKTDIEKLAVEVKKYQNTNHYKMPAQYKVPRKNVV